MLTGYLRAYIQQNTCDHELELKKKEEMTDI